MAEKNKIGFQRLSDQPAFNTSGGSAVIPAWQDNGTGKYELKQATPSQLQEVVSRIDKVYAPDLATVAAEGQANGFRVGESIYTGTLEINETFNVELGGAVNVEFGDAQEEAYYAVDLMVSSSNLNVYRFIGYIRTNTSGILTSDIRCIYSSEKPSYTSYRINVSDFFYEDGKGKLRIAALNSTTSFAVKLSITKATNFPVQGLDKITISEPYLHGLTLISNKSDVTYGQITAHTSGATGLPIYESVDGLTFSKIDTGTFKVLAGDFSAIKVLIASVTNDPVYLSTISVEKISETEWRIYTYELTGYTLEDYDFTIQATVE